MKIVFRIEHPALLLGPFSIENPNRDAVSAHTKQHDLPEAYVDVRGFNCGRHVCAVESLAQVHAWFGPFLQELHALGFILSAYELPTKKLFLARSSQQVAFDRDDAEVVAGLSLDALPSLAECQAFDQELFAKYGLPIPA